MSVGCRLDGRTDGRMAGSEMMVSTNWISMGATARGGIAKWIVEHVAH